MSRGCERGGLERMARRALAAWRQRARALPAMAEALRFALGKREGEDGVDRSPAGCAARGAAVQIAPRGPAGAGVEGGGECAAARVGGVCRPRRARALPWTWMAC